MVGVKVLVESIAIINHNGAVQISYNNPTYWWYAYQMKEDITPVQSVLEAALGKQKVFGADTTILKAIDA